jgi:hypothetical protein
MNQTCNIHLDYYDNLSSAAVLFSSGKIINIILKTFVLLLNVFRERNE